MMSPSARLPNSQGTERPNAWLCSSAPQPAFFTSSLPSARQLLADDLLGRIASHGREIVVFA